MRILHVVPTYYPAVRYGGPIRVVHGLASALAKRGHDVHVYTTNVDGRSNAPVPIGVPVGVDGVSVRYFPTAIGRRVYRSPEMGKLLDESISGFDIVHVHSVFLWPTTAAARAARHQGVPYILAPHGMLVDDLIRRKSRFAKRAWIRVFEHRNIERAAALHVTSDVEAADFRRLGLRYARIMVVPYGTDVPDEEMTCLKWRRPTILFLSRVNWKKGLDRLITAMTYLPEADLVIAGDDEDGYRSSLEALTARLELADRVSFLGPVHGSKKWSLFASAKVLALPSYSENFGVVVLESMAAGCPVVVTPEVGLSDVVSDCGAGIVCDGEPRNLARALRTILENENTAREMQEAGRKTITERFSWASVARQMESEYRTVISEKRSASHGAHEPVPVRDF